MTSGYEEVLFISSYCIPCLVPTLDNADPQFDLVITTGFYLHHVDVADHDPAKGSRKADCD